MEVKKETFSIPQLQARESNIDLEPGFQRGKVWKLPQKQKFLDSIVKGWTTPKIFLRLTDEKNEIYQCIDGQQRLRTIFEFLNNIIPLFSKNVENTKFNKLLPSVKDQFMKYQFSVDIITDKDDDVIGEFYLRLNQGVTVNSSEKLKSIGGGMKDFVWELSKNNFLNNKTSVKNTRDSYISICAQTCFLELNGIKNLKFKDLEDMFRKNKNFNKNNKEPKKIKTVYKKLDEIFDVNTPDIKNRASIISLYLLVSELMDKNALEGNEKITKEFFINFQKRLDIEKEKNAELMTYQNSVIQAQDSKTSIQKRHDILIKHLRNFDKIFQPYFPESKLKIKSEEPTLDKVNLILGIAESMDNINKIFPIFSQNNLRVARIHDFSNDLKSYNFLVQELNKWLDEMKTDAFVSEMTKEEIIDEKRNKKRPIQILEIYLRKKGKDPTTVCRNMRIINLLAKSFARHGGKELEGERDQLLKDLDINPQKIDFEILWEKTLIIFSKSLQELEKHLSF
jgi:hypothetical protein